MHTVVESTTAVEVYVNLTHPPNDIFEIQVGVKVFHNVSSVYISPNPVPASKQLCILYCNISSLDLSIYLAAAPDPPIGNTQYSQQNPMEQLGRRDTDGQHH